MKKITLPLLVVFLLFQACNKSNNREAGTEDTVTTSSDKTEVTTIELPPPHATKSTVKYSKVIGWPEGKTPQAPSGFTVTTFASGLKSPRNIYVAPNGDVFVALANTESKGSGKIADAVTGKKDSQYTGKSVNQVIVFRDTNRDDKPDLQHTFLAGLEQPFGMLILGNFFYVANTNGVWRYPYKEGQTSIEAKGEKVLALPAGGYNNHWTRNLLANNDDSKIYIAVGSDSDHGEHGFDKEIRRANILEINPDGSGERIYASGLRNPVGIDWAPGSNALWTVVNERDELGDELVPDYLTAVKEGGFYGWPYAYFGQHLDPRIKKKDQKPELVQKAIIPDVPLESHSSSMGLVFYTHTKLPPKYHNGAFVTQHGSWNRSTFSGYKVLFVPFTNGKPSAPPEDFLTGFIADEEKSEVYGRPVATAVLKSGNLLVTDDASGVIWLVGVR